MEDNDIQANIRAALSGIVSKEKARLHDLFDSTDSEHKERVAKLRPVFQALEIIKTETAGTPGIEISLPEHGHVASVRLHSSTGSQRFSISTNYTVDLGHKKFPGNTKFTLEESDSFINEFAERKTEYDSLDNIMRIVMDAIGKHIALQQTIAERKPR